MVTSQMWSGGGRPVCPWSSKAAAFSIETVRGQSAIRSLSIERYVGSRFDDTMIGARQYFDRSSNAVVLGEQEHFSGGVGTDKFYPSVGHHSYRTTITDYALGDTVAKSDELRRSSERSPLQAEEEEFCARLIIDNLVVTSIHLCYIH